MARTSQEATHPWQGLIRRLPSHPWQGLVRLPNYHELESLTWQGLRQEATQWVVHIHVTRIEAGGYPSMSQTIFRPIYLMGVVQL